MAAKDTGGRRERALRFRMAGALLALACSCDSPARTLGGQVGAAGNTGSGRGGASGSPAGRGGAGGSGGAAGNGANAGAAGASGAGGTGTIFDDPPLCSGPPDAGAADASAGAADGGTFASGCPTTEPTGGACAVEGLLCGYGDPIEITCRRKWACHGGAWLLSDPCAGTTARCPAVEPASGDACTDDKHQCTYPSGAYCSCHSVWLCTAAPPNTTCPLQLPFQGADCSENALMCSYGSCSVITRHAMCCYGTWHVTIALCVNPV